MKNVRNFFSIKRVFLLLAIITVGTTTLFAAGYLTEEDGHNSRVYVDDRGSVGIGTENPKRGLHISADYYMPHLTLERTIIDVATYLTSVADSFSVGVNNDGFLISDNVAGKTRFAIDPNGNIGIGTTKPESALHITTDHYMPHLTLERFDAAGTLKGSYSLTAGTGNDLDIYNDKTKKSALRIFSDGTRISGWLTVAESITAGDIKSSGIITATTYACTSDLRYKKNITPIQSALTKVLSLNGVTYNWKQNQFKEKHFTAEKQIGFIAQDVEKVIPEVVHTAKDGYKAISYNKITTVLVEAIKEMKKENDELRRRVASLERVHERIAALVQIGNSVMAVWDNDGWENSESADTIQKSITTFSSPPSPPPPPPCDPTPCAVNSCIKCCSSTGQCGG